MNLAGENLTHEALSESSQRSAELERRRDVRLRQESLQSNLGPVIDLSRSGVRVRCRRRLRGTVDLTLFSRTGPHLEVKARVVWSKRLGFRKHVAGLEFIDPSPTFAREVGDLSTTE